MQTIMVVDDRVTNRNILKRLASMLEGDIKVQAFADPREALDWAGTHTPDLVITDFKMPGMDGDAFIRKFREQPYCFDVPVIVVTVYEDRAYRYAALEAGATDFLLSPVDYHEFRARSRNLLTLRRQQQTIKNRAYSLERKLITDAHAHADAMRTSAETLRAVIDSVPACINAVDANARLVFINRTFAELNGLDQGRAIGLTLAEVMGPEHAAANAPLDAEVFRTGIALTDLESEMTGIGGERRVMLSTKSPIRDMAGEVVQVVTVAIDISARKESEEVLRLAKEEAEIANRSKTEFLANMSHELRTPLNAVIGFAEVMGTELIGPIGSPKYLEYARDISNSAKHLLDIINDILDVSKIEAGKLTLIDQECDIGAAVTDVLRLMGKNIEASGCAVSTDIAPDLPALRADLQKIKQILLNLVSNALKFTPVGGKVEVKARLDEMGGIEIRVSDSGIGMAEKDIPIAMSRFGQVEGSAARRYPGTGLGLPLCISLTELHGGHMDIQSRLGEGTAVTVAFPPERTVTRRRAIER